MRNRGIRGRTPDAINLPTRCFFASPRPVVTAALAAQASCGTAPWADGSGLAAGAANTFGEMKV